MCCQYNYSIFSYSEVPLSPTTTICTLQLHLAYSFFIKEIQQAYSPFFFFLARRGQRNCPQNPKKVSMHPKMRPIIYSAGAGHIDEPIDGISGLVLVPDDTAIGLTGDVSSPRSN